MEEGGGRRQEGPSRGGLAPQITPCGTEAPKTPFDTEAPGPLPEGLDPQREYPLILEPQGPPP